jgi:hypothetical protein
MNFVLRTRGVSVGGIICLQQYLYTAHDKIHCFPGILELIMFTLLIGNCTGWG